MGTKRKTISAENTFTDPLNVNGDYSVQIEGTFVGTVTLQARDGDAGGWVDDTSWTGEISAAGKKVGDWSFRLGIKTGDYTSGAVNVVIKD